jgi:hypothetical protein
MNVVSRSVRRLLVTAKVVPSSAIIVTLMMEVMRYSETSVLTRTARRNIPEDGIILLDERCLQIGWARILKTFIKEPFVFVVYSSLQRL